MSAFNSNLPHTHGGTIIRRAVELPELQVAPSGGTDHGAQSMLSDELLDELVERVADRIEERVIVELERRGRRAIPGLF